MCSRTGWNTDGNTLGTAIANTILLALYGTVATASANTYFNVLRLTEDCDYQADVRQQLSRYVAEVPMDSDYTLNNDLVSGVHEQQCAATARRAHEGFRVC